jgi:hypothetical protein
MSKEPRGIEMDQDSSIEVSDENMIFDKKLIRSILNGFLFGAD